MTVASLIEQIVKHPNSTFTPESVYELEVLSESVLQQILLGMTSAAPEKDVQTLNTAVPNATELQALLDDLAGCQEDLQAVAKEETRILTALSKFGVKKPSVLTYNTNNVAPMNDLLIQRYVQSGTTQLAVMLREGLGARKELRGKAINDILSSTSGVYTPQDLDNMSSADLSKLSNALSRNKPTVQMPDYSALTVADNFRQVANAQYNNALGFGEGVPTNDPINPPSLWSN